MASFTDGWLTMSLTFHESRCFTGAVPAMAVVWVIAWWTIHPVAAQSWVPSSEQLSSRSPAGFVRAPVHVATLPTPSQNSVAAASNTRSEAAARREMAAVKQTAHGETTFIPMKAPYVEGGSPWVVLPSQGMPSHAPTPPHLTLQSPDYQRRRGGQSWWSSHTQAASAHHSVAAADAASAPQANNPSPSVPASTVESPTVIPTQHAQAQRERQHAAPEAGLGAALFPDQSAVPVWPPGVDNDPGNVGPGQLGLGQHWIKSPVKRRPAIPAATTHPMWKTPYSYGHFGPTDSRHWYRHHGYRDRYLQWTLR